MLPVFFTVTSLPLGNLGHFRARKSALKGLVALRHPGAVVVSHRQVLAVDHAGQSRSRNCAVRAPMVKIEDQVIVLIDIPNDQTESVFRFGLLRDPAVVALTM